ncbi:MAG: sulfite oxidase [Ktedonobacteraceae bacterium]
MQTKTRKQYFNTGFIAGLAAGLIATAIMLLVSTLAGGISLPEILGSELTALMPAAVFDSLHRIIGGDAKHYLFDGILVGQCFVFALSGALYSLALASYRPIASKQATRKLPLYYGFILAFILWLLVGLIFLPLTGAGIFGAYLSIGPGSTMLSLALVGAIFGLLFVPIYNWLAVRPTAESQHQQSALQSRRTIVKRGFILAGVGIIGIGAWRFISQGISTTAAPVATLVQHFKSKIVPPPVPNYGTIAPTQFLSAEVTSNDQYYVVSKNLFSDPDVDGSTWQLTVDGQVDTPFTLPYQELLAQPLQQQYESMMCISNEVGGQYMSNALWEGVPLKDLLQRAGVKKGAFKVVFYAADDYSDSITLEKALEPTTLLAVHMNGVTLPKGHGFPVRMLVPGIYGMKHCKWLKRIEVVTGDYQGYWQQRGWSDAAPVRMTTRIDTPLPGSSVPVKQTTYIGGVAFSGNKGISQVDVSLDGGNTWQRATLKRPLSNLTWVLWEYAWQPASSGSYLIIARAIDMEGNVQDPNVAPPAPDGSSGYESFNVSVV